MNNKGILTVFVTILCLILLMLIDAIGNYSTGEELDYYLVKEITEQAMEDAVDIEYYRLNSLIRIDKDKFAESFIRRFADTVDTSASYYISLYDINETPPKVSVKVDSMTILSFSGETANLSTMIDTIIETNDKSDLITEEALQNPNNDLGNALDKRGNNQ